MRSTSIGERVARAAGRGGRILALLVLSACPLVAATAQPGPVHPRDGEALQGTEAERPETLTGDLDAMRERGRIRVLVPYSRANFFFDRGTPRGFAYEVFTAYARDLNEGARRGRRIRVDFVPVPRDRLLPWLLEGRGDVAAGRLTVTPERAALVDFADPIARDVAELPVTRRDAPRIDRVEDLSGATVHVRPSSSYHASLLALNDRLVAAGRAPVRIVPAPEHLEDEDLVAQVQDGTIPATVVDGYVRGLFEDVYRDVVFNAAAPLREGATLAWAVRKDSPLVRASLSRFVGRIQSGPNVLATLERRYFVENRWIRRASDPKALAGYGAVLKSFVRYGDRYAMDWAHLMAQGYQESGLDQTARNPSGAVGIMQILPTTAAAHPINLADVQRTETNIHAGTKYMRHLLDTYFADPGLPEDERIRFALAGYNAGPNRINRLRRMAEKAGLDPDVWYGNVEILAARHVGQETVTYVGNIEAYRSAFQAAMDIERLRAEEAAGPDPDPEPAPAPAR